MRYALLVSKEPKLLTAEDPLIIVKVRQVLLIRDPEESEKQLSH